MLLPLHFFWDDESYLELTIYVVRLIAKFSCFLSHSMYLYKGLRLRLYYMHKLTGVQAFLNTQSSYSLF